MFEFFVAKPFLQGVEFSYPDLKAFETCFSRFELWQDTGSIVRVSDPETNW